MNYTTYRVSGFLIAPLSESFSKASLQGRFRDVPSDDPEPPTYRTQRPEWSP
jgi:hypothetical protein